MDPHAYWDKGVLCPALNASVSFVRVATIAPGDTAHVPAQLQRVWDGERCRHRRQGSGASKPLDEHQCAAPRRQAPPITALVTSAFIWYFVFSGDGGPVPRHNASYTHELARPRVENLYVRAADEWEEASLRILGALGRPEAQVAIHLPAAPQVGLAERDTRWVLGKSEAVLAMRELLGVELQCRARRRGWLYTDAQILLDQQAAVLRVAGGKSPPSFFVANNAWHVCVPSLMLPAAIIIMRSINL